MWERLPEPLRRGSGAGDHAGHRVAAICSFCEAVLEAVTPHVPCVKIQSACFERYLWPGVEAYCGLVQKAAALGLVVIGDAKRGDIGTSARHYAAGCLADRAFDDLGAGRGPDALTVNAYLGADGLAPFLDVASRAGKGLFALVRTSNPGGDAIQALTLADGRSVAEAVAQVIADAGEGLVGRSGYSLLGAVVGATKGRDIARLRRTMPKQIFLVPGFGAQGGSADDVRACFDESGRGAVVTASRSVLYAFEKEGGDWQKAVENAALEMKEQVQAALV